MAAPSSEDRIFNDPAPVTAADGDASTSDEAMTILREQGVDAWRKWVADNSKD